MFDFRALRRLHFRQIPLILMLMAVSLIVISLTTLPSMHGSDEPFFTPLVLSQLRWFVLGSGVFLLAAAFDYQKLREFTWFFYLIMILLLIGLFFTTPVNAARRWYRLPGLAFQPSEYAKLTCVITLSWFLERRSQSIQTLSTALQAGLIVGIPFVLILKQPDLGSSLVLYPITLVMFYFGGIQMRIVKGMLLLFFTGLLLIFPIFSGLVSHEEARPLFTKVLKDYQYERLNPNTYHQKASKTAIALGGLTGSGFRKSEFTGHKWLPEAQTDSVFAAFTEEFGFIGAIGVLALYFLLIFFGFQVTAVAKDHFGRLLSSGITVYLAFHVIVNIGMMCKILPITGVPLVLLTYGGSSVLTTMAALGILQSVYTRRYMFVL
ncbi:MAG: FtsW/RodA/SpoVE family cell cycle protein [Simkaniaceae bacterium]